MFELFKLVGRVMVDNSGANQALDETDKKAQDATGNMGNMIDKLKGWASAAGAAIAGSAIVKGVQEVWNISTQVAEIGDNIDKSSQKFLMSKEAYQEWAFVAQRSGIDVSKLGDAVYTLSVNIGDGKEETLAVLEELGISAADAMTATPEELFEQVITGLQGVEDTTRRTYDANKLFGGSAKDLAPLLNMTADETSDLREEVHKLGGVMSDELVAQSATFADSQTNLQTAWDGVKYHLAEKTLPAMTQIVDGLTEMLTGDFTSGLTTAADGVKDYLGGIAEWLDEWKEKVRTAIKDATNFDVEQLIYGFGGATPLSPFSNTQAAQEWRDAQLDVGKAFDDAMNYAKRGRETTASDFFSDLWNNIKSGAAWDNLIGKPQVPEADEIMRAYNYFSAQGGPQEDFLAEIRERYGKEAYETVSEYIEAIAEAKKSWADGTEQFEAAYQNITGAMDGKTEEFGYNLLPSFQQIEAASQNMADAMNAAADNIYGAGSSVYGGAASDLYGGFSHARGLSFVPRDDYVARLHYGERVLTKQENDEYTAGRGGNGNTTINITTVPQSPAQTAAAITAALARARWAM